MLEIIPVLVIVTVNTMHSSVHNTYLCSELLSEATRFCTTTRHKILLSLSAKDESSWNTLIPFCHPVLRVTYSFNFMFNLLFALPLLGTRIWFFSVLSSWLTIFKLNCLLQVIWNEVISAFFKKQGSHADNIVYKRITQFLCIVPWSLTLN